LPICKAAELGDRTMTSGRDRGQRSGKEDGNKKKAESRWELTYAVVLRVAGQAIA